MNLATNQGYEQLGQKDGSTICTATTAVFCEQCITGYQYITGSDLAYMQREVIDSSAVLAWFFLCCDGRVISVALVNAYKRSTVVTIAPFTSGWRGFVLALWLSCGVGFGRFLMFQPMAAASDVLILYWPGCRLAAWLHFRPIWSVQLYFHDNSRANHNPLVYHR